MGTLINNIISQYCWKRGIAHSTSRISISRYRQSYPSFLHSPLINHSQRRCYPRQQSSSHYTVTESYAYNPPRYFRPTIFTLLFCTSAFLGSAYLYNDRTQGLLQRISKITGNLPMYIRDIRIFEGMEKRSQHDERLRGQMAVLDNYQVPVELRKIWYMLNKKWEELREGQQICLKLIGINSIVFLLWQVPHPAIQRFMYNHFTHYPASGKSYTLLTSVFSHHSLWHLSFNMIALYSFGPIVYRSLSKEEFLAFYLSAGVFSSYVSHVFSLRRFGMDGSSLKPSLGASGALFGMLGYTSFQHPDMNVGIMLIPGISFPLRYALPGLMAVDAIGILRSWSLFDHYAHLGGALVGLTYGAYGHDNVWVPTLELIRQLKTKWSVQR